MAVLLTLYLFYLDEGCHNFHWMNNIGNRIAFAVYVGLITGVQWLPGLVFLRRFSGWVRGALSALLGMGLVFVLIFTVFS